MAENYPGGLDFLALSKTQLTIELCERIISALQTAIYEGATFNSFEPMRPAQRIVKENGHLVVTEICYGTQYMNSYLDITYPTVDSSVKHPTLIYMHGGGFFGGSKSATDPMAAGDNTDYLFESIVSAGYNLVNVDYVLTPEGYFPDQLIQITQAIDYCAGHAEELHLDMTNVVVMGSSAGAILTGQYGALLCNPEYRERMGIHPKVNTDHIKCLVIDDAPFRPEEFGWKLKAMMGNFLQTTDMKSEKAQKFNAYTYFNENMKPCFLDAGPKDGFPDDMQACGDRLSALGVENEVFIPKSKELPHGFLNLADSNEEAAQCLRHMIAFMDRYIK